MGTFWKNLEGQGRKSLDCLIQTVGRKMHTKCVSGEGLEGIWEYVIGNQKKKGNVTKER